jgi:hypothetical protein
MRAWQSGDLAVLCKKLPAALFAESTGAWSIFSRCLLHCVVTFAGQAHFSMPPSKTAFIDTTCNAVDIVYVAIYAIHLLCESRAFYAAAVPTSRVKTRGVMMTH